MVAAALLALTDDIIITVGVYAASRFEVTPATIIGVLTILGYSLYDTVVVFDRLKQAVQDAVAAERQEADLHHTWFLPKLM